MAELREKLIDICGREYVIFDAPMSRHTSFKAGGKADVLVEPQSIQQLKDVLMLLSGREHMVMGNGSNILVRDGGYRGVIVKMGQAFNYIRVEGSRMICGAATLMSAIANAAASESLSGFEFASGIPGSIGGAVFMNAGAYEGETKNILESAHIIKGDGSGEVDMSPEDLEMGYRHTALHETGDIVTEVTLKLQKGEETAIRDRMAELSARRNEKQPVQYPSAGSFFKRPEGQFAGKLIQDAGCKGLTVGGAEVSTLHSGFIINRGGATATDIIRLKELVQACVKEQFDVMLEPEVRIIGEDKPKMSSGDVSENSLYKMTYDLHTHTTYSHGKGSVEDNVRAAIDKKLEFVAISDHGPGHLLFGVNRNDFPNIRNDINKMSVKYQSIQVRYSIEANIIHMKPGGNGLDVRPEEFSEFDFIIAGMHFACFGCSSVRNWLWSHGFKLGEKSLKISNTKMIVDALRNNDIAILTHPGDKGPFDIRQIAEVCAETGTLIEINGRHGHLTSDEIRIAIEVPDLKFIISSDAHTPEAVGSYKTALDRAIEAGLDISRIVNIKKVRK
ncbi:MAG: UDP-N-acetylmuramate dehydrogenase [Eubacteriales bacterium]|nr:UDP-N-acetylmuramate dehydrogenase [Eubacteriales bacterium]